MAHPLDIPDFLRVTDQAARNASWKGVRVRSVGGGSFNLKPKKPTDPGTIAFVRELARKEKAKQRAINARKREQRKLQKHQVTR